MSLVSPLVFGVLLPALVAGILLFLCARGESNEPRPRPFVGALALGLGYLGAHVLLLGMPPLPSATVQVPNRDWIAWFVAGAIVLAPLRSLAAIQRWSVPLYIALFSVLTFRFPLANIYANDAGGLAVRFALTLVMYMLWNATDLLAARSRGFALPAGLVVAGSGIAIGAVLSGSAALGQQTGAVCAGLGAAGVVGLLDRRFRLPSGAVAVALIVFAGALVNAAIYDLPLGAVALFGLAIVAPWLSELPRFASASPLKRALVAVVAAGIPAALACGIAYLAQSDPGAS